MILLWFDKINYSEIRIFSPHLTCFWSYLVPMSTRMFKTATNDDNAFSASTDHVYSVCPQAGKTTGLFKERVCLEKEEMV